MEMCKTAVPPPKKPAPENLSRAVVNCPSILWRISYGGGAPMPHPFVVTMYRAINSATNTSITSIQIGYSSSTMEKWKPPHCHE